MAHTLCTANVNNLYVRYKFSKTYPGDLGGRSSDARSAFGFLPMNNPGSFEWWNPEMREVTALALGRGSKNFPDILCLQEIESLIALRSFNEQFLGRFYKHALVIDAHDPRQIDVGILTNLEITRILTHMDETVPDSRRRDDWTFSRDCLEIEVELNHSGSKRLTVFVNHLKSKMAKNEQEEKKATARRESQAKRVAQIVRERFDGAAFGSEYFAAVGDFNDEPGSAALAPLVRKCGLYDVINERIGEPTERWTHWYRSKNTASQLDHILISPALARDTDAVPEIERRGIGFKNALKKGGFGPQQTKFVTKDNDPNPVAIDFQFERFEGVSNEVDASDHCPVFLEIP